MLEARQSTYGSVAADVSSSSSASISRAAASCCWPTHLEGRREKAREGDRSSRGEKGEGERGGERGRHVLLLAGALVARGDLFLGGALLVLYPHKRLDGLPPRARGKRMMVRRDGGKGW